MLEEVIKYDGTGPGSCVSSSFFVLWFYFLSCNFYLLLRCCPCWSTVHCRAQPASQPEQPASQPASHYLSICSNNVWPLNQRHCRRVWWMLGLRLFFRVINDGRSSGASTWAPTCSITYPFFLLCYAERGRTSEPQFLLPSVVMGMVLCFDNYGMLSCSQASTRWRSYWLRTTNLCISVAANSLLTSKDAINNYSHYWSTSRFILFFFQFINKSAGL